MQKRRNRRRVHHTMANLLQQRLRLFLIVGAALAVVLLILVLRPQDQLLNTPELLSVQRVGVLRVGVRTDVPGFAQDGEGLEISIAREIAQRIFPKAEPDIALELVPVTAYTALPKLTSGDIDLAFAQLPGTSSASYAYSVPYYRDSVRLVCRKGDERAGLAGGMIGMIEGSAADAAWKAYAQKQDFAAPVSFKYYASYPDLVTALKAGKLSYLAACGAQVPALLTQGLSLNETVIGTASYAAACSQENAAFAMLADTVIDDMKRDGTLDALIAQYGLTAYQAASTK